MKIGLIGIGTVGGGTYRVLKENVDEILVEKNKKNGK